MSILCNVLWIVLGGGIIIFFMYLFGGFWIAITHLLLAVLLAITVIGIPFAKQHIKLASLSLTPFGREIEEGD